MRQRPEPEHRDDPADAEPVERGDIFGNRRRRAVDHAIAPARPRPRQVALRHLDAQPGLPVDAVAHFGAGLGRRLEGRQRDALGLGIGLGHEEVAPHRARREVAGDRRVTVPGLAHRPRIQRDPRPRRLEGLHVHQERLALACQFDQ